MIYLQLGLLFALVLFAYQINHHDYLSPGFIFATGFCFSSLWACMYAKEWQLGLHGNTFAVITGGVFEFIFVSSLVHSLYYRRGKAYKNPVYEGETVIRIAGWKLNLFIAFEAVIIVWYIVFLLKRGSYAGNLTESIYGLRNERIEGEMAQSMPAILQSANYILISAGYWFGFVLVNNYSAEKKINWRATLITGLAFAFTLIEGGRNNSINILLGIFVFGALLRKKKTGFRDRLRLKTMVKIGLLASVSMYMMVYFAKALGRKLLFTPMYYLAIYCGADIKNLDIFLNSTWHAPRYFGEQTFVNLVKAFGRLFIQDFDQYYAINPYQKANGYYLANVYTTFKAFIHDFGYAGMIVLVAVMAVICQVVYEKALETRTGNHPGFFVLMYGFLFNTILFSFFSNKFYENLFSLRFARYAVFWFLFSLFFCRIRFVRKDAVSGKTTREAGITAAGTQGIFQQRRQAEAVFTKTKRSRQ